jgi:PKD repeat protein
MKNNIIIKISLLLMTSLVIGSCSKEEESSLKAVFSYVPDGFKVSFTNFSTGAKTYLWDFNDGSEGSTLKNPVHIFTATGEYTVKLTAYVGEEESVFEDIVVILGPNIKIDGDFSDWEYVVYSFENETDKGGTLRAVKTFAYGNSINFYFEGTSDMTFTVFDMFINSDNDPETGFLSWQWPAGSGADYLLEGSPADGWGSVYIQTDPAGHGWSWDEVATFDNACKFSAVKTAGEGNAIEFSIDKTKLGTVSGYITFSISELNESWEAVGSLPAKEEPTSAFLSVKL